MKWGRSMVVAFIECRQPKTIKLQQQGTKKIEENGIPKE
jgi:hypothetical protein